MGDLLVEYFRKAEALGGVAAKLRLAVLTRLTSTQAVAEPDSPAQLEKLASAFAEVERELSGEERDTGDAADDAARTTIERLRRHHAVFVELIAHRGHFLSDAGATLARVTEAAASALEISRVSIWYFDEERTAIRCANLYAVPPGEHSSGLELQAERYPAYFRALAKERTIAAHDARRDPRTSEFTDSYLAPLGITSMLDVPIWARGRMVGVICHEHTGPPRIWTADEESFAYLMANLVAMALEQQA